MNTPPHSLLEGQPSANGPKPAEPAASRTAEGVPIAVLPNPPCGDGRYPIAWLTICTPYGATPTATSRCECGRNRRAFGGARVLALIDDHTAHRDTCPFRNPQEGRQAA